MREREVRDRVVLLGLKRKNASRSVLNTTKEGEGKRIERERADEW